MQSFFASQRVRYESSFLNYGYALLGELGAEPT